ncbi:MAG: hypothetical protein GWN87_21415, partial [Desulfuromonadales bacterium]|nr:hypothetical protein [Desulfuromonadales bacterium]
EAHRQIEDSRQRLEKRVAARRKKLETEDQRDSTGVMKGLFGRPAGETELGRNRIRVTDEEERELQDIDVYLDNGIYSASRELAMVSNLAQHGAPDEPPEQGRGRAVFEARELSTTTPSVKTRARPEKEERPGAEPQKEEKRDIAQTPEEIRRKLEARKYQSSGKASFLPKDIEPADPQAFHGREPDEDKDQAGNDDKGK